MAGVGTSMGQMPRLTSEACEDLYIKLHIRPLRSVHMLYEHLPRECRAGAAQRRVIPTCLRKGAPWSPQSSEFPPALT